MAGICGIAVTPDLNYWNCPKHQEIIDEVMHKTLLLKRKLYQRNIIVYIQ